MGVVCCITVTFWDVRSWWEADMILLFRHRLRQDP